MPYIQSCIFKWKLSLLNPALLRSHIDYQQNLENCDLEEFNFNKRAHLIRHAFSNVPFYRRKYESLQFDLSALKSEEEFRQLPVLTKNDIRTHFKELKSRKVDARNYTTATTSGTTGPSLTVLHDKNHPQSPLQWRILSWWNIRPSDHKAFIYRYPRSLRTRILNSLLWWPTKRIFLAGCDMTAEEVQRFLNSFNALKPALLQGYTDVVYNFALYLEENDLSIYPPKAVWVTAAPLTDHQRTFMQKVFRAPVFDQYGSTEVMYIAAECRKQHGLHIMQDRVYVECVDENNSPLPIGSWGKLLITDLSNYAFPLIRYEIGDYGRLLNTKCSCGLPLRLMDNVRGRQSDVLKAPSGIQLNADYLSTIFDQYEDSIRQYQIVQLPDFSIEIHYVPMKGKSVQPIIDEVVANLRKKAGSRLNIKPIELENIESGNGKPKLVISRI